MSESVAHGAPRKAVSASWIEVMTSSGRYRYRVIGYAWLGICMRYEVLGRHICWTVPAI